MKGYLDFLNDAVRLKKTVTERERLKIEAWADSFTLGDKERADILCRRLQAIALKYPYDIEAKSLFALFSIAPGHALTPN